MLSLRKTVPLLLLSALITQGASAEDATTDNDANSSPTLPLWSGGAELGSIRTSGNTDTSSINGQFNVKREGERWTTETKVTALSSKDGSQTTKEKYSGLLQLDRYYSERAYLAIVGQQDRDRFSGFDYQGTLSTGFGYRVIKNQAMELAFEAGPGYYRERTKTSGDINEEAIARLVVNYQWNIQKGVTFIEEVVAEMGSDNQTYRSETGLKSQINGSLATKLTYKVKHVAEVPLEAKKTDTEFGVTLVYSF